MRVTPLLKRGWAMAPVVIEVARQVEKQVGPHVRAWQLANSVDGWVGRWTDHAGAHWVVFKSPDAPPLQAFPPLSDAELRRAGQDLDRAQLRHHRELPEAIAIERLQQLRRFPGDAVRRSARDVGREPQED
ncbi:hypothetical protein [Egicoccus sp. AB-alg2]|uniref:hypothetical protein n=1 Tax=Egicoccus sp. AB-alg2 TaxID=3242693 RepID=UPI00359E849B